jgi:hypothetical protein
MMNFFKFAGLLFFLFRNQLGVINPKVLYEVLNYY